MAKEEKNTTKIENVENVAPVADANVNPITEADKVADEKEAKETAKSLKKNMVRIKIPVDPQNPGDLIVPVMINGYIWQIKRGETVDVPEGVANILENAKYI